MTATVATRLAVCSIPLGAVFAGKSNTGSYAWGAVIAGAYAAGEALCGPAMGGRFQRRPLRRELAFVTTAEATALMGVVLALSLGAPLVGAALGALAGGVASGTFGGLRTLVVGMVPESREKALTLDVIANQVCQIAGPALVAASAVVVSPDAALLIVAGALLVAAAVAVKLPQHVTGDPHGATTSPPDAQQISTPAIARVIWPTLVVIIMVLMLEAVVEIGLPSILEDRHGSPAWAGIALSVCAVTSIVGSLLYGLRRWSGRPHTHTLVFAGLFALMVAAAGAVQSPVIAVVLVSGCGLFQAPASTARSLALTEALPAEAWPVAFSLLYSVGAVGFTIASGLTALFLVTGSAAALLVTGGLAALGIFAVTGWWEHAAAAQRFGTSALSDNLGEERP
jgi:MFS family permease